MSLFETMGIGDIFDQLKPAKRANVKSVNALEVEAMRCANFVKKPKPEGISALSSVLSENEGMTQETWTERYLGDMPDFTARYRRSLRNTLDWTERDIESLFEQSEPKGRNVQGDQQFAHRKTGRGLTASKTGLRPRILSDERLLNERRSSKF